MAIVPENRGVSSSACLVMSGIAALRRSPFALLGPNALLRSAAIPDKSAEHVDQRILSFKVVSLRQFGQAHVSVSALTVVKGGHLMVGDPRSSPFDPRWRWRCVCHRG